MNTQNNYTLVVVGAGSGGLTAARVAAQFGVRVALLERHKIGGDCLHTGCVPSKSIISVARKFNDTKKLTDFADVSIKNLNFKKIHAFVHSSISTIETQTDNDAALKAQGIDVLHGTFKFKDKNSLIDDAGVTINFKKCIIATGSQPVIPKIEGLDDIPYLTSDSLWDLTDLPTSLAVVGAGPIGLELGQAFAMLGSKVTVFEQGDRLVPRLGQAASDALTMGLNDSNVEVIYKSAVKGFMKTPSGVELSYGIDDKNKSLQASHVLIAVGRAPRTKDIGLETIGVKLTDREGVIVDDKLRTPTKNVYAVGDVIGGPLFTHWAGEQGAFAAAHALFGVGKAPDINILPSATFTTPEIAQVGLSEESLVKQNIAFRKLNLPFSAIDRAVAEHESGTIDVFLNDKHLVLGATIIGHNAAELIGYFVLLMQYKTPFHKLGGGIQAYPTYTINLKELAGFDRIKQLKSKPLIKLLLKLRGLR